MQKQPDIMHLSKRLLFEARNLPRHSLAIWRKDVSKLVKQIRSLEHDLSKAKLPHPDEDSIRLRLSEIHFIVSECRYHQFCTISIYFLMVAFICAFVFWL